MTMTGTDDSRRGGASLRTHDLVAGGRRQVWMLSLLGFCLTLGAGGVLWYLAQELGKQNLAAVTEDAAQFTQSVMQFRNFYTAEIVPRARESGMQITHAYKHLPNALPLPATFTLDFGAFLSEQRKGFAVQMFSAQPFPWRATERNLDEFQRAALTALATQPDKPFVRVEEIDGEPTLRYAVADRLKEACVGCHNTYPGSPKTDWVTGDVRGVLEVRRSLAVAQATLLDGLRTAGYMSAALIATALLLMWLTMDGLRRAVGELLDSNRRLDATKRELEQQIFALDQHAIVSIADRAGNIVYANDRFVEISGYPRAELLGQNHRIVNSGLHPREFFADLWHTISAGKVWSGEIRNRRKDGRYYWVNATIVPFLDAAGRPERYIGIRTDITTNKALEEENRRARETAEAANRAKGDFLANMSHEIRTPMNGIIGMTDLAIDAPSDRDRLECLHVVKHSAATLLETLNAILDYSKLESNTLEVERIAFDLPETVTAVLRTFEAMAREKKLALTGDIAREVPRFVVGDPARLRQVLVSLIDNAIKFTEHGDITIAVKAEARPDGTATLRFSVRDTGIGIPHEKQGSIFAAFTQADASRTRKHGGIGLGLTISNRLVELMGGRIAVDSAPGAGSTFSFALTLALAPAPSRAAGDDQAPAGGGAVLPAPTFDYAAAMRAMDAEMIEILVPAFLEHYESELAALRAALAAGNAAEATRRAHGLKGNLAAFGAEPAMRRAAKMEMHAKTGDLAPLPGLLDDLERELARLVAVLRAP